MKYRAKPILVKACQVIARSLIHASKEWDEPARLRRELGVNDPLRIYAGELFGRIITDDGQDARGDDWLVLMPDGEIRVFPDPIFRWIFAPADQVPIDG